MARVFAERNPDGSFAPIVLSTDVSHTIVLRALELDYRYHDDEPVHEAAFLVRFGNGYEVSGKLDAEGRACLLGVPAGPAEVRYGPDSRPFAPVAQPANPDYRPDMSAADVDALVAKYQRG